MKITHLMLVDKFTEPFIDFINNNFDVSKHQFLVVGKINDSRITERSNVLRYSKSIRNVIPIIIKLISGKKIIVHGLFSPHIVAMYYVFPFLLKKSSWVVWGGDLYYHVTREKNIKSNIYEYLRKFVIKRFEELITLTEGDYNLAKEWYSVRGRYSKGIYINPINIDLLNTIEENKNNKGTLNIQIGNSADPSNNHFQVLDLLLKYKNENIKIFAPLSYGDKVYAKEVKSYGKELFGSKFIAMTDFLKPEIYVEFLGSVDIAIFANNRQQALFNIIALIYLGKKVYIKDCISTWDYLKNKLSVEIFSYSAIEKIDFKEFTRISEEIKEKNRINISETLDSEKNMLIWSEIFKA